MWCHCSRSPFLSCLPLVVSAWAIPCWLTWRGTVKSWGRQLCIESHVSCASVESAWNIFSSVIPFGVFSVVFRVVGYEERGCTCVRDWQGWAPWQPQTWWPGEVGGVLLRTTSGSWNVSAGGRDEMQFNECPSHVTLDRHWLMHVNLYTCHANYMINDNMHSLPTPNVGIITSNWWKSVTLSFNNFSCWWRHLAISDSRTGMILFLYFILC